LEETFDANGVVIGHMAVFKGPYFVVKFGDFGTALKARFREVTSRRRSVASHLLERRI